jgi:hypothetical protein
MIYIRAENAPPEGVLSSNLTTIEKGESVLFDASGSSDDTVITEYYFDFGDGSNSGWISEDQIIHIYPNAGDFTAQLTVRDDDGAENENTAEVLIDVQADPVAELTANQTWTYSEESVTFNASDSWDEGGTILNYYFDYGDGQSSGWTNEPVIAHAYANGGEYTASLKVRDDDGDVSQNDAEVVIEVRVRPTAVLSANRSVLYKGGIVAFDALQSWDGDGTVEEFNLDYGDGENSGWTSESSFEHVYEEAGKYNASLLVRDDDQDVSANIAILTMDVKANPHAVLTANHTSIYRGDSVTFNASGSTDDDSSIVGYYFYFGDGNFYGWTDETTVTHKYNSIGQYTASVVVRDEEGNFNENMAEVVIDVIPRAFAVLTANQTTIFVGESVTFNGSKSWSEEGTIEEYRFDFGDGGSTDWRTQPELMHTYSSVGTFIASLQAKNSYGVISLNDENITITVLESPNEKPEAFIDSISPNPAPFEAEISFSGYGEDIDGLVADYQWRSSIDGDLSDQASFQSSSLSHGEHTIYFKVKDDSDEWSEEVSQDLVVNPPIPSVTITSPSTNQKASGTLLIRGTASHPDGDIIRIEIKIDDGDWKKVDGAETWEYNLDTKELSDGTHKVYMRAYDGTSYSEEDVITIIVENPEESLDNFSMILIALGIIIALIIVIVVLALRKPPKEKPDYAPTFVVEETDGEYFSM